MIINKNSLAGLEPKCVLSYFAQICAIPRGSGNTRQISDYLVEFAREHGLRYIQDDTNNVIIFKPASKGYEDHAPVILQSHMDMVCQKEDSCTIDMKKDPLDLTHDGTYVFAKGTTLGGDDGIGMALCLAVLADDSIAHPPLEVVITSDEETGLIGASAIDLSMLKGRRMLNLDTSHEGIFNVGCGGAVRITMELAVEREYYSGTQLQIALENFHGGHSGSVIGRGYVNTNKAMAQLLEKLGAAGQMRILSLFGGAAGNAIPSATQAVIAADGLEQSVVETLCQEYLAELKSEYKEPDATITVRSQPAQQADALTAGSTAQVLQFLNELPNGVQQWSPDFEGLPLLSLNLGVLELKQTELYALTNVRCGANQLRMEFQNELRELAKKHGCVYGESGDYSAWEYRQDSPLRDTLVTLYRENFHSEPVVQVIHAGLECGVLSAKIPGLDCVSIGPNIPEIHTVRERLEIASTQRTWVFLQDILKTL